MVWFTPPSRGRKRAMHYATRDAQSQVCRSRKSSGVSPAGHPDAFLVSGLFRGRRFLRLLALLIVLSVAQGNAARATPQDVLFSQSPREVDAYDFVELTLNVSKPDARNPFTEVTVEGHFE